MNSNLLDGTGRYSSIMGNSKLGEYNENSLVAGSLISSQQNDLSPEKDFLPQIGNNDHTNKSIKHNIVFKSLEKKYYKHGDDLLNEALMDYSFKK